MELWKKAEEACTQVITSGQYDLAANPEEVCTSVLLGGSRESIYETITRNFWNEDISAPVGPKHIVEECRMASISNKPTFICCIQYLPYKSFFHEGDVSSK